MRIAGFKAEITLDPDAPNTRIDYTYRDGDNYKISGHAVIEGSMSAPQAEAIVRSLDDGMFFIPGQVGLRDLQGDFSHGKAWSEADHVWHELVSIQASHEEPTTSQDARHVDGLCDEWPERDGWDVEDHHANLAAASIGAVSRPAP